jgi:hypothetical protein
MPKKLRTTADMRFHSFQSLHPNCTPVGRTTSHIGKRWRKLYSQSGPKKAAYRVREKNEMNIKG